MADQGGDQGQDNNKRLKLAKDERRSDAAVLDSHRTRSEGLEDKLAAFWREMMEDVENSGSDITEFKTQQLPLARIKKIMKSDEDVRMISAEAPVLFAKACEFFILEMTLRAWHIAEENKRKTLTKGDIAAAVARTEVWDFLADTVPQEDGGAAQQPGMVMGGLPLSMDGSTFGYVQHGNPQFPGAPGVQMYQPQGVMQSAVFAQQGTTGGGTSGSGSGGAEETNNG